MSQLEALTGNYNGYALGPPSSRFGWAFFTLSMKPEMENSLRDKFSDMICRYTRGSDDEKFTRFMGDYFESKGCEIKLKNMG